MQDLPVEIQVRTRLQDLWAQIVESLGDRWGRGIRYGEPPRAADTVLSQGPDGKITRQVLWDAVGFLAEQVAEAEADQARDAELLARIDALVRADSDLSEDALAAEVAALKAKRAADENKLNEVLETFAKIADVV